MADDGGLNKGPCPLMAPRPTRRSILGMLCGGVLCAALAACASRAVRQVELASSSQGRGSRSLTLRVAHEESEANNVEVVAWSPEGQRVAIGTADRQLSIWSTDKTLWKMDDRAPIFRARAHEALVSSVAWSPRGGQLATGSIDGSVKVWSMEGGVASHIFGVTRRKFVAAAWSPDGKWLAFTVGSDAAEVHAWPPTSDGPRRLPVAGDTTALVWSPDSQWLAVGNRAGAVVAWQVAAAGPARVFAHPHGREVDCLAWSPGGQKLAIGYEDGTISVLDTGGWQAASLPRTWTVNGLAFSPNGMVLASTSTRSDVALWDPVGLTKLARLAIGFDTNAIAWSPDGHYLACGADDHSLKYLSVEPPQPGSALNAQTGQPGYMARRGGLVE